MIGQLRPERLFRWAARTRAPLVREEVGAPETPAEELTRAAIARHFLRGQGLEIGALHNPLALPPGATARYVDVAPIEVLRERFPEAAERIRAPDIVDDGELLATVADASQDFLIANHLLEHCEDPIGAIETFVRVVRPGGMIFMAVPDKRYTFDLPRAVTSVEHAIRDHVWGPGVSRRAHYEEWLRVIDGKRGKELEALTEAFMRERTNIHFHVWTVTEMFALLLAARNEVGLPFDIRLAHVDPPRLEVVWVLEVTKKGA
nr:methyltransferase domain-containing protein [Variovorax sp. IB41]